MWPKTTEDCAVVKSCLLVCLQPSIFWANCSESEKSEPQEPRAPRQYENPGGAADRDRQMGKQKSHRSQRIALLNPAPAYQHLGAQQLPDGSIAGSDSLPDFPPSPGITLPLCCGSVIWVGDQKVRFEPEATRWLGIWPDSSLTLVENRRRRIAKTRQAEARLRRIVTKYGVPPAATRGLQSAIVQGIMLYAAELTWNGKKDVKGEYQNAINCMGRPLWRPLARHHWGSLWSRAV